MSLTRTTSEPSHLLAQTLGTWKKPRVSSKFKTPTNIAQLLSSDNRCSAPARTQRLGQPRQIHADWLCRRMECSLYQILGRLTSKIRIHMPTKSYSRLLVLILLQGIAHQMEERTYSKLKCQKHSAIVSLDNRDEI